MWSCWLFHSRAAGLARLAAHKSPLCVSAHVSEHNVQMVTVQMVTLICCGCSQFSYYNTQEIPAHIFDHNPELEYVSFTQGHRSSLQKPIPAGLFDKNPKLREVYAPSLRGMWHFVWRQRERTVQRLL